MKAGEVLKKILDQMGDKEIYPLTGEEADIFITAGAMFIDGPVSNDDGTFSARLQFRGKLFFCDCIEKLHGKKPIG